MPSETVPQPRAAAPPEARGNTFRQETAALAGGLERIRTTVLERLDRVETTVKERASRAPLQEPELVARDSDLKRRAAEIQQRQTELQQRTAEMDEAQRRTRTERDRWENERTTMLEQLEHDRRLIAEAWERLEREKLENPEPARAATALRNGTSDRQAVKVSRLVVASNEENPVAQAILRQFQAVRRDVGSSRVDLQACKLEYSIVSPK